MLKIINKEPENRMADTVMPLYRLMVWPPLEYCMQFWVSYLEKCRDGEKNSKVLNGWNILPKRKS